MNTQTYTRTTGEQDRESQKRQVHKKECKETKKQHIGDMPDRIKSVLSACHTLTLHFNLCSPCCLFVGVLFTYLINFGAYHVNEQNSFKDMSRFVLKATKQHAKNLAFFATIYKTLLIVQRRMHGKERPMDSFLAGLVGGYMVFGENNNVNQQVNLL